MAQPNIPCPFVANGYLPGDTPDIPVIPPPVGGGDTEPTSPVIIVTRTDPHNPAHPPTNPDGGGTGGNGGGTGTGASGVVVGGGFVIPGPIITGDPLTPVIDSLNSSATNFIDDLRFNIATQNIVNKTELIESDFTHELFSNTRDKTIDNILKEVNTKRSYNFSYLNDITFDKIKQSIDPKLLDIILNLHVEDIKVDETQILNNLLNKLYQNELSEVSIADINNLKQFVKKQSTSNKQSISLPKQSGYSISKKDVSKSREVTINQPSNTNNNFISLEDAVKVIQLNKKSLTPSNYKNIYFRDLMKFWYKVEEDDQLTTDPYILDLKDEIRLITALGEDPGYILEVSSVPTDNLESNYILGTLSSFYLLTLDESSMEDIFIDNFLMRKTRVKYTVPSSLSYFEDNFKHKAFPYLVTYVHYNDPIVSWLTSSNIGINLTIPSITLQRFNDYSLVRRIPTHIIVVPTNRFNNIPRGGKSEVTAWGTRTLTLNHSIDDTRRSNSQLLTSPIFEFKQTWPGINIDTIYNVLTRTGIPVTLTNGDTDVIPVSSALISFVDKNSLLGNIPTPGNNLYVTVNGITYAIPVTSISTLRIYDNSFPYSLESNLVYDPPISRNNYVPTLSIPTGNTHPTLRSSPTRLMVRIINYLKNNYSYDTGLTYYDVYSRMENTYRYGLNFEITSKVKEYIANGGPTNIKIYGSTYRTPTRVISFNLIGQAELFPNLNPVEPSQPPSETK